MAVVTMVLENLEQGRRDLRKLQSSVLELIAEAMGKDMPDTAKRRTPRVRCGVCSVDTKMRV